RPRRDASRRDPRAPGRLRGAVPASDRGGHCDRGVHHDRPGHRLDHAADRAQRRRHLVRPGRPASGGPRRRSPGRPGAADARGPRMTALEGARAWVEAWKEGWERHDPGAVAARYAPDCRFRSAPFRALEHGRAAALAYATRSFEEEVRATVTLGAQIR